MNRLRVPLLIVGIILAIVVAVGVFFVVRLGRGTAAEVPVAVDDIPPRTPLEPAMFRLQEVRGLDRSTLESFVEADEFAAVVGHPTLEMVHAGSPLLWAQVDPEQQTHLTLAISGTEEVVYPLPVTVDQVGDFLVAGDTIDVIFTLGRVASQELVHVEEWEYDGPAPPGLCRSTITGTLNICPGDPLSHTTILHLPLAKVILPDVRVLHVEREVVRTASTSYGLGTGADEETRPRTVEGDIIRIYLVVDREEAEVLSFALHNGALNLPARAAPAGGESEGFTWEDFQELFFQGRPEEELRGSDE